MGGATIYALFKTFRVPLRLLGMVRVGASVRVGVRVRVRVRRFKTFRACRCACSVYYSLPADRAAFLVVGLAIGFGLALALTRARTLVLTLTLTLVLTLTLTPTLSRHALPADRAALAVLLLLPAAGRRRAL